MTARLSCSGKSRRTVKTCGSVCGCFTSASMTRYRLVQHVCPTSPYMLSGLLCPGCFCCMGSKEKKASCHQVSKWDPSAQGLCCMCCLGRLELMLHTAEAICVFVSNGRLFALMQQWGACLPHKHPFGLWSRCALMVETYVQKSFTMSSCATPIQHACVTPSCLLFSFLLVYIFTYYIFIYIYICFAPGTLTCLQTLQPFHLAATTTLARQLPELAKSQLLHAQDR